MDTRETAPVRVGFAHNIAETVDAPAFTVCTRCERAEILDCSASPAHGVTQVRPPGIGCAHDVARIVDTPGNGSGLVGQSRERHYAASIREEKCTMPIWSVRPTYYITSLVDAPGDAGVVSRKRAKVLNNVVCRCCRCLADRREQ